MGYAPGETEETTAEETTQTPQEKAGEEEQSKQSKIHVTIKMTLIGDHRPEHPFLTET